MRNLCITADDYGMHRVVNDAIEDLAAGGHISAVAVMVHANAVLDSCTRLTASCVATGAHLVFTQERPRLPQLVGTALAPEGHLPASPYSLMRLLVVQPRLYRLLWDELSAQLDHYIALELPLDFINSHEHVHQVPFLWNIICQLAEAHGVTTLRSAHVQPLRPTQQGALALLSKVSWLLRRPRRPLQFLSPLGAGQAGRMGLDEIATLVDLGASWHPCSAAVPELVVHPALDDEPLRALYGEKSGQRRAEYDLLRSTRLRDEWRAREINLIAPGRSAFSTERRATGLQSPAA